MEATNKARDTAGEFLVVWQNYKAQGPDELTLHEGDVVELLDTIDPSVPTKKQKLDPELDAISGEILNTSAARHKLSVKPRRTYASSRHSPSRLNLDARWLVREVKGSHKEGWVPCQILQTADEPVPGTGLPGDAVYRRQAVVKELVETEQEFVKDLDYVVQNYLIRSETAKVPKILKDNFDLIFGNLKQIANFHSTVLMEGVKYYANEPHLLGKAFLRLERDFDKHVSYCSDEPQVQMFLDSCDEARDYFDELSQRLGDDKSLSEHLKLPIQRINDYQLLLKELVRYSACLGEEHSDLQKALELMLSIPNRAEDDKFINSIEGYRGSIHKLGRLLAHDWFSVQFDKVTKERYLFLFKARILICKVRRISEDRSVFQLKDIIRLPQVEIKDHPDDRVFELIDKTVGHSLILTAHRDHVKEYWVKEIKEFASEAVDIEESGSDDFQLATPPTESSQPTQPEERAKLIEKSVASQEIKQSKVIIVQESEIKEQKHTEISKSKTVSTTSQQSESKKTSQQSNVNIQPNNKEETSNPTKRPESSTVTQNPSSNPSKPTETQNPPAASSSPKPPEKLPPNPAKPVTQNPLIPTEVPKQSEFLFKPDTENPTDRDTALKKVYSVEKVPAIASEVQVSDYSVGVEVNVEVAEDMSRKYSALSSTAKSEGYESSYSRRSVLHSSDGVSRYATESSVSNKYGTGSDSLSNRYSTDLGSKYGIESSVSTSKYEELANKYGRSLSQSSDHDVIGKYGDTSSYSRKSLVGGDDDDAYSYSKRTVRSVHVKDDDDDSYTSRRSIKERRSLIDTDDDYNFSRRSIKDRKKLGDEEDSYSYARRSIKSVRAEESGDGELNYTKRSVHISREGKSEDDYGDSYSYRKFSIGDDNSETKKRYVKRSISKTSDDEENKYIKRSISRTSDEGEGKYNRQHSGNLMEYDDESSYSRRSVRNRERKGSRTYSIDKSDSGNSQSEMVSVKKVTEESVINGKEVKKEEKVLETDSISLTMKTSKEENISAVVDDKSVFTKHIRGTNIEPGESATFEVALAEKPESLIWLKDNKAINGNGSMSGRISSTVLEKNNEYHLLLKQVDHSDAGLYTAVATYPHGKATCSAQLVVHELSPEERRERAQTDKPEFLVQLKDTELLESTYLRFMVKVIGDPNPEIAFFKDGVKVPENSERIQVIKEHSDKGFYELVIPDVKHSDAGQYKCVASNKFGEASSEATVTVTDSKNIFDDLNTDEILQPGEKINFSWKKDGQPFEPEERFKVLMGDDEDSLALVFQHVRPEDVGLYTCVAQTSRGHISCSAELTVHGTVNQLFREPEKPILVIEKREAIVTAGGSAMLELQCKGYPKPDVKWKHEGKPIEPSGKYKFLYEDEESMSLVIKDVQPSDSGKYEIIAENELGKDTSDITLTVKAPPKIKNKMEDVSISADMELKMTVEIEGTPKPTVQFYKDGQEVKQSDRIKIVSEGEKHTLIINKTTLKDSGSYSVVATNELAQVSQFWKLNVFTKPKILQKLGSDKQVSQNEQVQLKVQIESEPAPEVSWFKDDQEISSSEHYVISKDGDSYMLRISGAVTTDSAKYKFKAMNIHGTVEDDVRVDVKRGPTITKPLEDMTVTEHDTNVTFDVKVEAFPKPTVKWFLDEVEISETRSEFSRQISDDGAKLVIKEVTSELSGKYTCKVVNELGATECSAKLTVNCKPRIIKHLKDTTVDEGATLYLEVEVDACPEPTVKWLRNGREVSADARIKISRDKQRNETYNLAVDLIKYEEQGEYEVIITNALGTVTSKSNVTVHKVTLIDQLEEDEANIVQTPLKQEIVEIEDDSKKGVSSDKFEIEEILEEPPIQAEQKEFEQPEINQGTLYEKVDIEEKQMKCKSPEPLVEEPMSPNIPQTSKLSTKEKAEIVELDESDKAHPVVEKDIPRRRPSRGKSVQFETIEEIENIVELKTPTEQELPRKNSLKAVSAIKEEVEVHDASSEPNIAIESDVVEEKSQKGISAQKESAEMVESDFDSHKKKKSEEKIVRQESQKGVKDFVEEDDEELESLLRRAQKQRSLVEDISIKEIVNDEAIPTISDSNMKDDSRPASLDKHFIVRGTANPPPVATWYLNGKEIKPDSHLRMTASQNGDEYRLDIVRLEEKDAGVYECRLGNLLGEAKQQAKLEVTPEKDLRRPKLKEGLIDQTIVKKNTVTMFAVIIGDPIPDVTWSFNGKEITMEEFEKYKIIIETEDHDIEDGLKECKFSLTIPRCERVNGGQYSIKAKNKWGECDSSAQLTIILRPEIEGPADVAVVPGEPIQFTCKIQSNPLPSVTWSKDDKVIEASDAIEIIEDTANETYTLKFHKVLLGDEGYYKVTAKNHLGEDSSEARLKAIKEQEPSTEKPKFITGLTDNPVEDGGEISVMVRADGLPKPEIHWYFNGNKLIEDENHKIEGHTETQVTSTLTITNYKENDIGIYKAVAVNVVGEAETNGRISMLQTPPSFGIKLERSEEVNEGEPLELKAKIHGSPKPKVAWYKDGEEISPDDEHIKTTLLPDGTVKLNIDKVLPEDSGAYKLVVRNPNGETAGLCAVAVNQKPQRPKFIKCIKDTKATLGEPFRLEAQVLAYPPPEIKWLKDGLPIRGSSNVHFENHPDGRIALVVDCAKPETAGNYQLIVSNKLGENTGEAKVEIEKKPTKPEFILKLKPMTVVEGFPVKFEVKADGFPAPKISWIRNGAEVVSDKKHVKITELPDGTSVLVLDACDQVRDALTYKAVASNEAGEATTSAPLTVTPASIEDQPEEKPLFLHSLKDVITDEGQPLILEAPFNGNPIPSVEWTKDGVPLQPSDRILLTCDGKRVGLSIDNALPSDAGKYGVTIINPLGKDSTEAKAIVHKVYQPPTFTQRFTDLQQLPNRDAKFPARVSGVPQPEVAWSKDGVPITESDKYRIKRDGDACCLYINNCEPSDAGVYRATATNKEGEDVCTASLEVVEEIKMPQKIEPPVFLKRIGDTELFKGMTAKFTACASGHPEPNVEWFKDDQKLFPSNRIKMEMDRAGLLRLTIAGVDVDDVGKYSCKISNEHGSDICHANLRFDAMDTKKRPIQDQYIEYDKYKRSGAPVPLSDPPIISRMTDRHCTLSWKPSIPSGPRAPVTYQLEMCELPNGDWFTVRSGIRSCTCGVRNLEPFRDYKFRVRVENKYGISEPSPYAITHREKLEPEPPKFMPYLEPGIDFRPETSPYFPKDFDIDRPPHDNMAQAPRFLRQEHDTQYGVKDQNTNLFWFVYGYPKPKMTYYFNDELIESGGRFDMSYTRNGQATLFINKMLDRDVGWYEAVAKNEHGEARQRVRLEIAELPTFIKRPDIEYVMVRGRAHFVARIVGVPYPEIKWYKDWKPLAASSRIKIIFKEPDTTELIINEIILKDEGLYSVSARNVAGSASSSAMLHIEENDLEYNIRTYSNLTPIKSKKRLYTDLYDIGDELGRGTQGVTYHAVERMNGRNYAAKIMHGRGELRPFMYNELDILNQLRHRKLISLHDAYESDDSLALILELASGGELVRDYLIKQDYYTEGEIAGYIRQLLQGLEYMHERGFGHMGLNIGDLLLSHPGGDDLKIGDFGLARRITMGRLYSLNYGVPEYVSPEAANGQGTGLAHDMWSVGIITYILLSGYSPFRGKDDRETLMNIQGGKWSFDESWWSKLSFEARDFITKLLVYQAEGRMDVHTALRHPWLERADKQYSDEYRISSKYLSDYFSLYREWYDNASCKRWFRRRPLEGAFTHPSRMVYPPGDYYTPPSTPAPEPTPRKRTSWEDQIPNRSPLNYEIGLIKSESHYQNGPDTYLLQLRDVDFPVRLREYMKVAANRGPGSGYIVSDENGFDWQTPVIRERRRFTDVMDEEIDDERKARISKYGTGDIGYTTRRLRHELGSRLDTYVEAEAFLESKQDGRLPFFREKPQLTPLVEGKDLVLSCFAVGEPKPLVQWFKNDAILAESHRIKIETDDEGRSHLKLKPALGFDIGMYKVVARNKVGQTVARTRIVLGQVPDEPDSPQATEVSDTEVLLTWKQPKFDGHSPVLCYSLEYKLADDLEWTKKANNIDHEFYLISGLEPNRSYIFRLAAYNAIGWSEQGVPSAVVNTKDSGAPKIHLSKAMSHLQQLTDSGHEVEPETITRLNYTEESNPIEWSDQNIHEKYNFISEISRGRFSTVLKAVDKSNDKVVVAKCLELTDHNDDVEGEFAALRSLRHERIAGLLAAFRSSDSPVAIFILEKLQGSDIVTYLASRHEYTEQTVATVVAQILDALQYLHWRGLCHLDVQPDNVVMCGIRSIQVKLVDLGSAHRVTKLGNNVPVVGHYDYISPEVLSEEPAFPQSDIWSVGVLTYVLLSGTAPFKGEDENESRQNILFVRYRFEHLYKELSQEATRFLMLVFKRHPNKRPTAEECHENRWLLPTDYMIKKRERAVFLGNRLKEYSDQYHAEKKDSSQNAAEKIGIRGLIRSHSIQEELLTAP